MLLTKMHKNLITDSACSSPLSAPLALTPKNTDFHADYSTLENIFVNEIYVLRSEDISNKQYVDQVLADANISSRTSKSYVKIEF